MRHFVGIDLGGKAAPDETSICKFRHLTLKRTLGAQLLHLVNEYLKQNDLKLNREFIVDRSIISAPSSTKKEEGEGCDPDMHQTKKGNQRYFSINAHTGVDSETRLIHSVAATGADIHETIVTYDLLHGEKKLFCGDSAFRGKGGSSLEAATNALDLTRRRYSRHQKLTKAERELNCKNSRTRTRVEHIFGVMKGQF